MRNKILIVCGMLLSFCFSSQAQNTRINDHNAIGWYNLFATLKFTPKWGAHFEYQFRRDDVITKWQQSLLRLGINYQLKDKILLRAGYAWVVTFPYGDHPIQKYGKIFPEHRIFEMVQLSDNVGRVGFQHRFMLEQRFLGKYSDSAATHISGYTYVNRMRYMCRVQVPINKPKMESNTVYMAAYDEIMIGFGKNVNANIFDQNRIGILAGYQLNKYFRIEGGYLSQIVMLGRTINNNNVIQYNNGLILNAYLNFEIPHKAKKV